MLTAADRRALANQCCGIVQSIQSAAEAQQEDVKKVVWPDSAHDALSQLIEQVRSIFPERFSVSYLRNRLRGLVGELAGQPIDSNTQDGFAALFSELEVFSEKRLCVAATKGIARENDDPIAFGPFILKNAAESDIAEIHAFFTRLLNQSSHTVEEQSGIRADLRREAEGDLAGRVILKLEVVADAEQAHAVFIEKAATLMDLLQMSTCIAEYCDSARIGLEGNTHSGRYSAWVVSKDSQDFYRPNRRTGGMGHMLLDQSNLFLMRRAGIMRLADAIGRTATPLENALLRASHWFAQSTLQEYLGHRILSLVICLEALLRLSSGRAMAESVALLVGNVPHERRSIYALVQEAFLLRNSVVHEGDLLKAFPRAEEFQRIVLRLFAKCVSLCDQLETPESLTQHVSNLRFS